MNRGTRMKWPSTTFLHGKEGQCLVLFLDIGFETQSSEERLNPKTLL